MPILDSKLDTRAEVFQQNKSDMLETLAQLQQLYDQAAEGGGEEAVARIRKRGKMLVEQPLRVWRTWGIDPRQNRHLQRL